MSDVKKIKCFIEAECEVEGGIEKVRELVAGGVYGAEVNMTDITGVTVGSVKCVRVTEVVEQELDLDDSEEETTL